MYLFVLFGAIRDQGFFVENSENEVVLFLNSTTEILKLATSN